ncbi:uncharacterized protein LOC144123686 [Amblyomma americanum]
MEEYRAILGYQTDDDTPPFLESPVGMITILETCLALVLFGGLLQQEAFVVFNQFMCCSAATYFFNDFCFLITSVVSRVSAACMPSIFYYEMFHFTAFATFVLCGVYAHKNLAVPVWIAVIEESQELLEARRTKSLQMFVSLF